MPRNNTTSSRPTASKPNYSFSKSTSVPKHRTTNVSTSAPTPINTPTTTQTYTPSNIPTINIGQPTMWDSVKQGFGFGVGSSIARNIFSGKEEVNVVHEHNKDTIKDTYKDNKEYCSSVFESYQKCITEGSCSDDLVNHLKQSYDKCKSE
jgi:hypothetical protein